MDLTEWLLSADPAVRWQVLGDLMEVEADVLIAERARVAREGLGAAILASQSPDGVWRRDGQRDWIPTLYTAQLLRITGVDPADPAVAAAIERLATGFHWHAELGGKPFFAGETEPCINGVTLAAGAYFGHPNRELLQRLLSEQLADGGWNCEAPKSTRSSFHTTICVLEGLLEYERANGPASDVSAARARGEAYLRERGMFRRLSTGEPANPSFLTAAFPPRCYYDILRGLDYLREAEAEPDDDLGDAVRLVMGKRTDDERWLLEATHDEAAIPFGERVGEPSQWNTLRALRVLKWFEGPI